jgi:DNA-binding transcriptional ArsR family regulator
MTQMSKDSDISLPLPLTLDPCCKALGDLLSPRFFKALGDPNRIVLLSRLAASCRPCTVTEISCCCPVDISVVSRHLAMLRDADIVQAERRGKQVLYTVRYDVLAETFRSIADAIEACCVNLPQPKKKEPDDG